MHGAVLAPPHTLRSVAVDTGNQLHAVSCMQFLADHTWETALVQSSRHETRRLFCSSGDGDVDEKGEGDIRYITSTLSLTLRARILLTNYMQIREYIGLYTRWVRTLSGRSAYSWAQIDGNAQHLIQRRGFRSCVTPTLPIVLDVTVHNALSLRRSQLNESCKKPFSSVSCYSSCATAISCDFLCNLQCKQNHILMKPYFSV